MMFMDVLRFPGQAPSKFTSSGPFLPPFPSATVDNKRAAEIKSNEPRDHHQAPQTPTNHLKNIGFYPSTRRLVVISGAISNSNTSRKAYVMSQLLFKKLHCARFRCRPRITTDMRAMKTALELLKTTKIVVGAP